MTSQTRENLFLRDDTFFGVCEALGEMTRIPANLFRIALAPLLIWNPVMTFVGYCALGLVIAAFRFVFPVRGNTKAKPAAIAVVAPSNPLAEDEEIVLAKAA